MLSRPQSGEKSRNRRRESMLASRGGHAFAAALLLSRFRKGPRKHGTQRPAVRTGNSVGVTDPFLGACPANDPVVLRVRSDPEPDNLAVSLFSRQRWMPDPYLSYCIPCRCASLCDEPARQICSLHRRCMRTLASGAVLLPTTWQPAIGIIAGSE